MLDLLLACAPLVDPVTMASVAGFFMLFTADLVKWREGWNSAPLASTARETALLVG